MGEDCGKNEKDRKQMLLVVLLSGTDDREKSFSYYYLHIAEQKVFWMVSELKMQHITSADTTTSFAETFDHSCKLSELK